MKKDLMKVAVFLAAVVGALVLGFLCGLEDVRRDAVKAGAGHYEADEFGKAKFQWGVK